MNQLSSDLKNTYVVLRHGKSLANEKGIILSHPDHGVPGYGLVDEGKEQVRTSVMHAKESGILDASTVIVSSDFARAKETAEIAADVLGVSYERVSLTPKLRERYFGTFDGGPNTHYETVWAKDHEDSEHKEWGVESVEQVLDRAVSLINNLERKYSGKTILLVSHGDTLQILQTAFDKVHPSRHRSLPPLTVAEIRTLR